MITLLNQFLLSFSLFILVFSLECLLISTTFSMQPEFYLVTSPQLTTNFETKSPFNFKSQYQNPEISNDTALTPDSVDLSQILVQLKTYKLHGKEVVKLSQLPSNINIPQKHYTLRGETVIRVADLLPSI